MKTEKQIVLKKKEIGLLLAKQAEKRDVILIQHNQVAEWFQGIDKNLEPNLHPLINDGVFRILNDKPSSYSFAALFSLTGYEDGCYHYTWDAYMDGDVPGWLYSCEIVLYVDAQDIVIKIQSFEDAKTVIYERQGNYRLLDQYLNDETNKQENIVYIKLFLKCIEWLNFLMQHPEYKKLEATEKREGKRATQPSGHAQSQPGAHPNRRTIVLNGVSILTQQDNIMKKLRSRKIHRVTQSWSVRGHYRHYRSGKCIYVAPYIKGKGEKMPKNYIIE